MAAENGMVETIRQQQRSDTVDLRAEMAGKLARWTRGQGATTTAIPWLGLSCWNKPTAPNMCVYDPLVAIVVQGRKEVAVGQELLTYDESHFLLTSVDLPVAARVVEASETRPFLAMIAKLDLTLVRQWIVDYDLEAPRAVPAGRGIATGPASVELLQAFRRLLELLEIPQDIPVLSDLIAREIVYRVLKSACGGRLWQLAMTGSQSSRIQKVINWLRHNYAEPLRVEDLAGMAAMSVSSMHHHFREITSMSPLQFQKQVRLQEARRLMLIEDLDAGVAAVRVGYESASQFSREYHRLFGKPPLRDVKIIRTSQPSSDSRHEGARSA